MVSPSQMFQGNLRLYILDLFFASMAARDIGAELQLDSKVLASRFNTFKNQNQHQREFQSSPSLRNWQMLIFFV